MTGEFTLGGVIAKLERAAELVGDLDEWMIYDYLLSYDRGVGRAGPAPFEITAVADWQKSEYTVTVFHLRPPDHRGAILFGDIVHNLRSALDHFARQLILNYGGEPKDGMGGTTFPILSTRPRKPIDIQPFGTVPEWIRDVLDSVQPYANEGSYAEDPLYRLNELDNIDKHRLLHVTALTGRYTACFFPKSLVEGEGFAIPSDVRHYPIDIGSTAAQVIAVHSDDLHEDAVVTGQYGTEVVLAEAGFDTGTNISGVARQLHHHVKNEVVRRFTEAALMPHSG